MFRNYPSISAFISYVGRFKRAFWTTAAIFAVADAIISLIPWLIGRLTAGLTTHNDHEIVFWTGLLILASVGHDGMWRLGEFSFVKRLMKPSYNFDDDVFRNVLDHNYNYFVSNFTGKISSYENYLGTNFRTLLNDFQYSYVNLVVAMPIIAATMFTVNLYTGLIFAVSLALMFMVGRKLAAIAARAEKVRADESSTIDGHTVDAITNFVSIKAFASEAREAARLHEKRQRLIQVAQKSYFRSIWFWGVMSIFVRWVIWPSTFILNVYLYMHGHMSLAQMTTFLAAIVLFSNFIWDVIWQVSQVNIRLANIEEGYRYLFGERNIFAEEDTAKQEKRRDVRFTKTLQLHDLSFAYPDKEDTLVLKHLTLDIHRSEKIGIVGPSGGGKSTLMKLLLGYYPVADGQLLVDGQTVASRDLTDLISYVPQDTAIFHRTIGENIAYARSDASFKDIVTAAKHAQADSFIRELPEGYDTLVGERGVKLSGGQRQRIAIARALLKGTPLLMLDEATSALDSESEVLIQKALGDLLEHRTALVIAHRLSTIQTMDRILVIDKGEVVEEGSHQELLAKKGVYAKLWAHQSGGFIEE